MAIASWSRNKKLTAAWIVLLLAFMASAIFLAVTSAVWRSQDRTKLDGNTLRRLTIGHSALTASMVLAISILVCAVVGVGGFWSGRGKGKGNKTMGLVVFNWSLFLTAIVTVSIGSIIWFCTLRERNDFMIVWMAQDIPTQMFLQDTLSCCGYWNATTSGLLTQATGFCGGNLATTTGCVDPITDFADNVLNNVFTTIYGFTAIQVSLFLTTACLIISRREEERFRLIDAKRGTKGGFV